MTHHPPGYGHVASAEGGGGHQGFLQPDPAQPAHQVVGDHVKAQPGAVGTEAARGQVIDPVQAISSSVIVAGALDR